MSCCLCEVVIGAARAWSHHTAVRVGTSVDCNRLMSVTGNCGKTAIPHIRSKVQTVFYKNGFCGLH
jgi:hypothetical protein